MRRVVSAREQYETLAPWRVAALTQDLVDNLRSQFNTYAAKNGLPTHDDRRGPIGHWPHVESFLKEHYPAANKDWEMGQETARDYLTPNATAYETGPEAHAKYGYDPKEIAAGMLLLHNQSHPFRGDFLEDDQKRLNDIFDKRQQMQRAYEQRQPVMAWRTATPWHSKPGDPTYSVPTQDLLRHRQFNPAITTPEQMQRSLWTQSYDPKKEPYRNFATPWSSGGSSEGSSEDDLVEAFEKGHKLPPVEITTNGVGATLSDGNHRAEVADMLSHPDLESYIHYDPHKYQDDFHAQQVDPNTELGRQIHKLVQNHPYEPVDGGPTTDHVFRRHPETGEWQRGTVDHSSAPRFVDDEDYAKLVQQNVPGYKHDGLGTYFDVDWGNGPEITHERHLHARLAMADTAKWHPHIELFNDYHDPESDSGAGEYWLRLPDESQPSGKRVVGTATYEYNGPEMYVHGISVNPRLKGKGIGQALVERMHADHPQRKLNPGETTAEGHGLTQRLMQTMPGKVIPDYQPRPLSAPESKQWLDTQQEYWDRRSKDWDSLQHVGRQEVAHATH